MSNFMLIVFPAVLLGPYLKLNGLPSILGYAPEFAAIAACAVIVVRIATGKLGNVPIGILLLLGLLLIHVAFGLIANSVQAGPFIVGARLYFRAVPFFLLALLVFPSAVDLKKQLYMILGLAFLQVPLAVYQKLARVEESYREGYVSYTGDVVQGTVMNSGFLSIFLIAITTILVVLYTRRKLNLVVFTFLMLLLLIPTLINETKVTLVLIPIAIMIPMIARSSGNRIKKLLVSIGILSLFLAIFVPVYDSYMVPRRGESLLDFMSKEGRVEGYLSKGAEIGSTGGIGRVDGITIPLKVLRRDPVSFIFGLGMGSITESTFGKQYEGRYYSRYGHLKTSAASRFLWETGFLGVFLVYGLLCLVFIDARRLVDEKSAYGMLGQCFIAVVPIIALTLIYADLVESAAIGVIFWYYAGVVVGAAGLKRADSTTMPSETGAPASLTNAAVRASR